MTENKTFFIACIAWIFGPIILLGSLWGIAYAQSEDHYNRLFCDSLNGTAEVVFGDRTRCDCLTDTLAIETDFSHKWYEAVGQSLHYSTLTGKTPGIYLIIKDKAEAKYLQRLLDVIHEKSLEIVVFVRVMGKYIRIRVE